MTPQLREFNGLTGLTGHHVSTALLGAQPRESKMTHVQLIQDSLNRADAIEAKPSLAKFRNGWANRHRKAMSATSIGTMITALALYADAHKRRFESNIGEDYVLGDHWGKALREIRGLLNGELDGLDGGATDGLLLDMLKLEGFDENGDRL